MADDLYQMEVLGVIKLHGLASERFVPAEVFQYKLASGHLAASIGVRVRSLLEAV